MKDGPAHVKQARALQQQVLELGDALLERGAAGQSRRKDVIELQRWVKRYFSSLAHGFFLADSKELDEVGLLPGDAAATTALQLLTAEERQVQLRTALGTLLERHITPALRRTVDASNSMELVRTLAALRKDWSIFLVTVKYMLMPLDSDAGRGATNQVEAVFTRAFRVHVFRAFRERLLESLLEVVECVRRDPARLPAVQKDARDLVRHYCDALGTRPTFDAGIVGDAAGDADDGPSGSGLRSAVAMGEWVVCQAQKIDEFHRSLVEPYKAQMVAQHTAAAREVELTGDASSLARWIGSARTHEHAIIVGILGGCGGGGGGGIVGGGGGGYAGDFDLLRNHLMFEFDSHVTNVYSRRVLEDDAFGIAHTLSQLPLENASVRWDARRGDAGASGDSRDGPPAGVELPGALAAAAETRSHGDADARTAASCAADEATLVERARDLYLVAWGAQTASLMPEAQRTLPRTALGRNAARTRAVAAAAAAEATQTAPDAPAFAVFKSALAQHARRAVATVVDSLRVGREFRSEREYALELCSQLGAVVRQKACVVRAVCDGNFDAERAYAAGFRCAIAELPAPTFLRVVRAGAAAEPSSAQRYPDLISAFLDASLINADADVDAAGETAAELLAYVADRDIFVETYRVAIARRLLSRDFTDQVRDREDAVLALLKRQLPPNMVRRCGQGMMDDLAAAAPLRDGFAESALARTLTVAFNPRVLSSMSWPPGKPADSAVALPPSLAEAQAAFERWYVHKHATRQLRWQLDRTTAVVDVAHPLSGRKEVAVTAAQAIVLLAIDRLASARAAAGATGGAAIADVCAATGMRAEDVECVLVSMCGLVGPAAPQLVRIVSGSSGGSGGAAAAGAKERRRINVADDGVEMNPDFADRRRKLALPPVPRRQGDDERVSQKSVDSWRTSQAEACIVAIMKSARELSHVQLLQRCLERLQRSFTPQPQFIKHCVQGLISKGYMERAADDHGVYLFVA
jgi:hypothetical protein